MKEIVPECQGIALWTAWEIEGSVHNAICSLNEIFSVVEPIAECGASKELFLAVVSKRKKERKKERKSSHEQKLN